MDKEHYLSVTALMWEDIVYPRILDYLSLKDLFSLRGVSKEYQKLVECYFSQMKYCDLSEYCKCFSPIAFSVSHVKCFYNDILVILKDYAGILILRWCIWITSFLSHFHELFDSFISILIDPLFFGYITSLLKMHQFHWCNLNYVLQLVA